MCGWRSLRRAQFVTFSLAVCQAEAGSRARRLPFPWGRGRSLQQARPKRLLATADGQIFVENMSGAAGAIDHLGGQHFDPLARVLKPNTRLRIERPHDSVQLLGRIGPIKPAFLPLQLPGVRGPVVRLRRGPQRAGSNFCERPSQQLRAQVRQ